ncbi:hypothetical protein [Arthrobacter dokdonensis]|uniref:hypothetical protein n=1 Tax=Arthrobacter dokdonellae TaxID=2211210 RepID=UPI000DE58115|nr:hypothetical protein [Arthrobacter dokdonellae]
MVQPAVLENLAWADEAIQAIEAEARTGRTFDAYQLQQRQGVADPPSVQQWGSVFKTAARRGIIQQAGFHITNRPTRRGGITRVWVGSPACTRKNSSGPGDTITETA